MLYPIVLSSKLAYSSNCCLGQPQKWTQLWSNGRQTQLL